MRAALYGHDPSLVATKKDNMRWTSLPLSADGSLATCYIPTKE
jgi:hypothetical protein